MLAPAPVAQVLDQEPRSHHGDEGVTYLLHQKHCFVQGASDANR